MSIAAYCNRLLNISRYLVASLVPMALNLLLNPWVAKNMTPVDYATVGYYKSFVPLIQPLIVFYVLHYYTKCYFELSEDSRVKLQANIFKFLIYGSGVLSLVALMGIYVYSSFFNAESSMPLWPYIYISTFALPIAGVYQLALVDMKMKRQSSHYLYVSIAHALLACLLLWILVVILKWGAIGYLSSTLIVNLVFFMGCLITYRDLFYKSLDIGAIKQMMRFCFPLTLAAMLSFFSGGYEKIYLERLNNTNELGIYVVGATIAGYILVFSSAVGSTFQPDLFKAIANRNIKQYLKYASVTILATAVVSLCVIAFAPLILNILTSGRYVCSAKYLSIISLSAVTSSIYFAVSQFTIAMGLTKIPLYNKVLGSIICVVMYKIMIDEWYFDGAAYGVVLSFVVFTVGNVILLYFSKTSLKRLWTRSI